MTIVLNYILQAQLNKRIIRLYFQKTNAGKMSVFISRLVKNDT
ncbi:hypothetical protein AAEO50_06480 [Rossellomorea oryzaecorticis]|uniref:Uncharacterized protein n=1 Tax=Rossellomorea oryzaecorticis TaxID=1396505 RepID=A0ABU9K8V4_9BACI